MILGNDYNAHNHEVFVIDSPCGAGKQNLLFKI